MDTAKSGDTVRVHYTGWLEDGTQIDTSIGGEPLEFTLGTGQLIPGFEAIVMGMEPGQTRKGNITPEDAYGAFDEEKIQRIDRDQFPEDAPIEAGQQFQATRQDGESVVFSIMEVEEDSVIVDANHPLVGQTLTFEIKLLEIAA